MQCLCACLEGQTLHLRRCPGQSRRIAPHAATDSAPRTHVQVRIVQSRPEAECFFTSRLMTSAQFVDFRGKSATALDSFIRHIGPSCGGFVTSISQRPVNNDSDVDSSASVIEIDWGELLMMDLLSSRALRDRKSVV